MINKPRGTEDILPENSPLWRKIEQTAHRVCESFGYKEIRTPVFEDTSLFQRGVGDTTDVVQKEMYTFEDKGGRSITLRPEGTASGKKLYRKLSIRKSSAHKALLSYFVLQIRKAAIGKAKRIPSVRNRMLRRNI